MWDPSRDRRKGIGVVFKIHQGKRQKAYRPARNYKKGFGLPEAEENPALYHSLACKTDNSQINMSEIVGRELLNLGEDERVVAVSAAMTQGVGLKGFAENIPKDFLT